MSKDRGNIRLFLLFLLPTLFVYGVFIIYPVFSTLNSSFYDWSGLNDIRRFIGFENYRELFKDPAFIQSMVNNLWVVLVSVFVQIPLGLTLALVVSRTVVRSKIYKVVYFLPYLMSTVAIGLTWSFLYDPMIGVINKGLSAIGVDTNNLLWLADERLALMSVLIVVVWNFAPFYMIMFNAAMSTISEDYYEAASIDGATTFQKFRKITFPLLIPSIASSTVLSIVGSLKSFDLFYIMTKGGPGSSTELMGTYMYKQGFTYFKMGYASSAAFTMFFVAVISIMFIRFVQSKIAKEASY